MKFSTRQDVDAPLEEVFARASDFPRFERIIRGRGVALARTAEGDVTGQGVCWQAGFEFRGKERQASARLDQLQTCEMITITGETSGVKFTLNSEFVALSPTKSRIIAGLELRPQSLPARVLVQGLKLNKQNLDRKFAERIRKFAESVQDSAR